MDRNKFYFHHLTSNNMTKLVKIKGNCKINIYDNAGQYNAELIISSNGYYINGNLFPTIKIIKDSDYYYIVKTGYNQNEMYVNIDVSYLSNNNGFSICDYVEDFDDTDYETLLPLNYSTLPINKIETTIDGNSSYDYTSINRNVYNQSFTSLVVLDIKSSGASLSNVYLMTKSNGSSINQYTITPISENTSSTFTITGTNNGFTISSGASSVTRIKILELACGSKVN